MCIFHEHKVDQVRKAARSKNRILKVNGGGGCRSVLGIISATIHWRHYMALLTLYVVRISNDNGKHAEREKDKFAYNNINTTRWVGGWI